MLTRPGTNLQPRCFPPLHRFGLRCCPPLHLFASAVQVFMLARPGTNLQPAREAKKMQQQAGKFT
jgi:hypothetical protein